MVHMSLTKVFKGMLIAALGLALTACYQQSSNFEFASEEAGPGKALLPDYALLSPQVVVTNMTDQALLALPATNESPRDITTRRVELGDADPANRIFRNPKPSAGKYKTIFENYINACSDSMGVTATPTAGQAAARTRLFPNASTWSAASFDTLYLSFFGRKPSSEEVNILLDVVNNSGISDQVKHAVACAAALSSLEALNGT